MSVYTYYNWTAVQYQPVKLQLQLILLLYCVSHQLEMYINISLYLLQLNSWPVPTSKSKVTSKHTMFFACTCMLSLQWQPALPDPTHFANLRQLQVKPTAPYDAALGLRFINPLFYQQLFAVICFAVPRLIIVATVCQLPTRTAEWQREKKNGSCQIIYWCNPYMILALALVSELFMYIVGLQLLCVKFYILLFSLYSNIIVFFSAKFRFSTLSLPSTSRSAQNSLP